MIKMTGRRSDNNDRSTEQFRKLFIGGLALTTTEDKLKSYYERWGELVDVVVMKERGSNRSRGFGFVTFRDPEMVDAAQAERPHEIDGKNVETKRAMPREDSSHPESHMTVNRLFVGKLSRDTTSGDLREYFSRYGNVVDSEIVTWKESGEPRGFGFVTFDDYDPVDKAILYKPHHIGSSRAEVKKALSKDQINEMRRKQDYERPSAMRSSRSSYAPMPVMEMYEDPYAYAMPSGGGGRHADKYYDEPPRYADYSVGGGYDTHAGAWDMNGQMSSSSRSGGAYPSNNGYMDSGDRFGQYSSQRRYGGGPMRGGGGGGSSAPSYAPRSAPYRGFSGGRR